MGSKKLTKKQEMFCKEYLIDLNATQAAIRAGYSEKTAKNIGAENLAKPYLSEYIQKLMDKRSEKTNLTAESILNDILEVKDRCMQKVEPITYRKDGEEYPTGEYKFEHNGALKALELLGKHLKLFTDKVEHSGKIELPSITVVKK
jgi:phage terminase small subunit